MEPEPETGSLFFASNGEVTQADLDNITLSLLTYGDRVWIPASFSLSPFLNDGDRLENTNKIASLIEAGFLRLWTLEGGGAREEGAAHKVVPQLDQANLQEAIDTIVLPATPEVVSDRPPEQIDTASRIIETRHELWHLGIAAQCSAPGVVLRGSAHRAKQQPVGFENLRAQYAKELFDRFHIHSLGALQARDISDLRDHITSYRSTVDKLLNTGPTALQTEEDIVRRCREQFREYLHLVDEAIRGKMTMGKMDNAYDAGSLMIEAAGYSIPFGGLLPLAKKFYLWLKDRHRYRFAFYLHRVKRIAEDRAAERREA